MCWRAEPGTAGYYDRYRLPYPEAMIEDLARTARVLPAAVLGDQAGAFDADLAARLGPHSDASTFAETVSFCYELAQKPR